MDKHIRNKWYQAQVLFFFFLFFNGDTDLISDFYVNICIYSINTIADWKHVGNLGTNKSKSRAEGENKREGF